MMKIKLFQLSAESPCHSRVSRQVTLRFEVDIGRIVCYYNKIWL